LRPIDPSGHEEVLVSPVLSTDRAPIDYESIRVEYQTGRAAVAATVFIVATILLASGTGPFAVPYAVGGLVVAVDALYRRSHGSSATAPLLIDITALGAMFLIGGASTSMEVAALAYGIVAMALLLPARMAALLFAYALAWSVGVAAMNESGILSRSNQGAFDAFLTVMLLLAVAALIAGTTRVLIQVQDRQQTLLEQERRTVEVKNEFVSMVSHELRTPITGISGFSETLRDHWRDLPPSEVDEFLTILRAESEHLENLVEDILVIPRLESGHLRFHLERVTVLSVAEAVAEIVFDETTSVEIDIPVYIEVWSDPARLRQILRNLMENALKYGGNEVHIFGEERREGTYTVIVADNGNGVAEGDRQRIFEHFEQLSKGDARIEQGVGLGLPIARKLTRAMGGDLWYEDRFPVGAQFCFDVDLVKETEVESDAVPVDSGVNR
jgi:signal transduction histidine kinase